MRAVHVAAVVALVLVGTPAPSSACSVCQAGDPVFSSGAAGPRESGSLSAFIEYQGSRKDSGLLPEDQGDEAEETSVEEEHEEEDSEGGAAGGLVREPGDEVNRLRQLNAIVTWGVVDRLSLSVQIPFKSSSIRERPDNEEAETSRLTGLGDVSLTADYVLWRDREVLPENFVTARFFGKAPTGDDRERKDGRVDPHLQRGTGSWDYGVGLGAGHRMQWGSMYASALYRVNRQGANRYEYGDVILVNAAIERPLGAASGNSVALELNFRHARRDVFESSRYRDSGGSIFYATPSFRFRLPWLSGERVPTMRMAVQLPFGDGGLLGQQHEGLVWSAGLIIPLR